MDSTVVKKRKRVDLSIGQKKKICKFKEDHPELPQDQVAAHFSREWGVTLGRSTISDILRLKDKWMNTLESDSCIRSGKAKHQDLEKALFYWFQDVWALGVQVKDNMIVEQAKKIGENMGIKNFEYSSGWLKRFKSRYGIPVRHRSLDKSKWIFQEETAEQLLTQRKELCKKILNYPPENIFAVFKTGLFYCLEPDSTHVEEVAAGKDEQEPRFIVALCSNSTGTEKIKPLVVGRSPCSEGTFLPNVYVQYRSCFSVQMTHGIFREWIGNIDKEMALRGRHILLLLLDNMNIHHYKRSFSNIEMYCLTPDEETSFRSVWNNITYNFKLHYRRNLVRYFLDSLDDGGSMQVTLRRALRFVKSAWDWVESETILDCWQKSMLLPQIAFRETTVVDACKELEKDLVQFSSRVGGSYQCISASDYIECDLIIPTSLHCISDNQGDASTSSSGFFQEDNEEQLPVQAKDAKAALYTAISYFEEHPEINSSHLDHLWLALVAVQDNSRYQSDEKPDTKTVKS